MKNAEDIAKLANVAGGMGGSGMEALKSELLARFSGAAPGGPIQFAYAAATPDRVARRRISPYEAKGAASSAMGEPNGSGMRTGTLTPFFSQLPPELMGGSPARREGMLMDVRLDRETESASAGGSSLQSAMDEFEASQRHSASLGVASALVQTALASFKRLTQGQ